LQSAGARVVLGAPGCMSKVAQWRPIPGMTLTQFNSASLNRHVMSAYVRDIW